MASKLVLVTGASSGIGEATAKRYAAGGAHLFLLARSADRLERIAAEIAVAGGTANFFPVDLSHAEAVGEVARRIAGEFGTPDILINNAGAGRWLPLVETSPAEARAMIELPYLAAFYVTRAFLPAMLARGSGNVVCVTSPASYLVWPRACAYIAARQALKGFTEALRSELHGSGVTATLVVLGYVDTPYWQHNPGSRENVPKAGPWLMPVLSADDAAITIIAAAEMGRRLVARPQILRLMFLLNALAPNLVAAQLRRATRRHEA